jgi:hypothetical protein
MGGHVACMGEMRNANKVLVRKHKGRRRNHMEYLGTVGKIILEWVLEKQCGSYGTDSSGSG